MQKILMDKVFHSLFFAVAMVESIRVSEPTRTSSGTQAPDRIMQLLPRNDRRLIRIVPVTTHWPSVVTSYGTKAYLRCNRDITLDCEPIGWDCEKWNKVRDLNITSFDVCSRANEEWTESLNINRQRYLKGTDQTNE